MRMKKRKLKRAMFFEFPPEVVAGGMSLSIYENIGCSIENYGSILTYTEQLIRVESENWIVRIEGDRFHIAEMDDDTLMLNGCVRLVEYEKA